MMRDVAPGSLLLFCMVWKQEPKAGKMMNLVRGNWRLKGGRYKLYSKGQKKSSEGLDEFPGASKKGGQN